MSQTTTQATDGVETEPIEASTPTTSSLANSGVKTDPGKSKDVDGMIPRHRFNEINDKYKTLLKQQEKAEAERLQDEKKRLEEERKFEDLYSQEQSKVSELEARIKAMEHNSLRRSIATEAGHPALWQRIQGDDEAALKADMDALLKLIPTPKAPDLNGATGSGRRQSETGEAPVTQEEKARLAATYGIPIEHWE